MKTPLIALSLYCLTAAGCGVVAENAQPSVQLTGEVRDKWVRRGMTQNERGVAQGRAVITVPTAWSDPNEPDETLSLETFANMDLSDSVGDAWFGDDNAGRVSSFDIIGTYMFRMKDVDFRAGVANYSLPNGVFFPNGPRGATTEMFAVIGADVLGVRPEVQMHYDFDQANGFYFNANLSENFELAERLGLTLRGSAGYSTSNQSHWDYGLATRGLTDAELRGDVTYAVTNNTTVGVNLAYTTIMDRDLRNWFGQIGIEHDQFALGLYSVVTF